MRPSSENMDRELRRLLSPLPVPEGLEARLEAAFLEELSTSRQPAPTRFPWPHVIAVGGFACGLALVPGFWDLLAAMGRLLLQGMHWLRTMPEPGSLSLLLLAMPVLALLGAMGLSRIQDEVLGPR